MPYNYEDDVNRPFIETQQVETIPKKKCCNSGCVITGVAIFLIILGVILAVAGPPFFKLGLPKVLRYEIKKTVIIDSPSSEGYDEWLIDQDDEVPVYYGYYMFNLTNPDQVVNSHENPIYQQLGPYIYRRFKHKVNVQFLEDGEIISYYSNRLYVFQANMSNGSNTDLITNVNPAYVGTMVVAGGDGLAVLGLAAPILLQMIQTLTVPFVDMSISWNAASALALTFNNIMTTLKPIYSPQQSLAYFCTSWANDTLQPEYYPDWTGLQLARGGVPSNISMQACQMLFSNTTAYSLINTQEKASTLWMKASYNVTAFKQLQAAFPTLTPAQLQLVVSWRNNTYAQTVVLPELLATFGVTNPQDLALVQWGTGGVIPGTVEQFFSEWPFPVVPEFWLYSDEDSPCTIDVTAAKTALYGPYGVTVSLNLGVLLGLTGNEPSSAWGLTDTQRGALGNYMTNISATFGLTYMTEIIQQGGSIVTTKTVEEWLWTGTDPLLERLTPDDPYMCVQGPNNQTQGETRIWTGKNDTDKINQYIMWRNQTSLSIWESSYNVTGYTETGQFAPFMNEDEEKYSHLHPFDNNLIRTLDIYKNETTSIYGIDLWRYLLNDTTFLPDPFFFQFVAGMCNMTSFEKGAPIYLSQWDFVLVDPKYTAKVTGVYPNTTDPRNIVDVEPITGITMGTVMKLQVNLYIPPNTNNQYFSLFFSNVTDDTFYPLVKIYRSTEITEHLADEFKEKVYLVQKLEVVMFWVTLSVGVFLVAASVGLLTIRYFKKRSTNSIN